jgi:hypothetical protein
MGKTTKYLVSVGGSLKEIFGSSRPSSPNPVAKDATASNPALGLSRGQDTIRPRTTAPANEPASQTTTGLFSRTVSADEGLFQRPIPPSIVIPNDGHGLHAAGRTPSEQVKTVKNIGNPMILSPSPKAIDGSAVDAIFSALSHLPPSGDASSIPLTSVLSPAFIKLLII